MTTVTLTWDDPEDAVDFLNLAADLRRDIWLPDPSRDRLVELVQGADVVLDDGSEDDGGGDG